MAFALFAVTAGFIHAQTKNGFDLMGAAIPAEEIYHGGPSKDGIPAIDEPKFLPAGQAAFLTDNDRVLGVVRNGIARAYPIAILNWHEIVNDRFKKESVVISFCPLCGTGVVFSAHTAGLARTFGVSGLLYNSDVLLYDRESESLWSQLLAQAVTGPLKGTRLKVIPSSHTTWRDWKARYPDTLVLSTQTGYVRDYNRDPYAGYVDSRGIFFPVKHRDPRYHPKERVVGVEIDGRYKAYPFAELAKTPAKIVDVFAGQRLTVIYDGENQSGAVYNESGREIPTVISFWFAWYAFHPDTEVFRAPLETKVRNEK